MDTILLMLSGGIDSTCLLHYYLTETKNPIHVHHVSIRYPQLKRWVMEDPAVKDIVDHCQNAYRPFEYSESQFGMEPMNLVGFDQALVLLIASKVAPNLPGDHISIALGHIYNDIDSPEVLELSKRQTMHKLWLALRNCCLYKPERLRKKRSRVFLDLQWEKEEVIQRTPAELLRLCWSCRRPDFVNGGGIPCGQCTTCMKIESILTENGQSDAYPNLVRPKSFAKTKVMMTDPQGNKPHMQMNTPIGRPGHAGRISVS